MERKNVIVQRAREYFGDNLDQVLQTARQDRQELFGWEEPPHLRAVLRRAVRAEGAAQTETGTAMMTATIGRGAGEPDSGQQRETLGRILEVATTALEKMLASQTPDMSADELFGLECALLLYGRPAVLVSSGRMAEVPASWNHLEDQRDDIELTQRAVGRIEMVGHPDYDWAGTGFLVGETCLMTTRLVAQMFAECPTTGGGWQFRPGISAWMDYQSEVGQPAPATYRLKSILGVHERYDLALLEVEPPQQNGAPAPLSLALEAPPQLEGRPVYLVGYPIRDSRRNEPEAIARIFRDNYNVKRVHPGTMRGVQSFRDVQIMRHDCAPLGCCAGGCLIDLATHRVLGIHVSGRYLENGTAVPLWALKDDPMFKQFQVTCATASREELQELTAQLERLGRTRLWEETRDTLRGLYQRAFRAK